MTDQSSPVGGSADSSLRRLGEQVREALKNDHFLSRALPGSITRAGTGALVQLEWTKMNRMQLSGDALLQLPAIKPGWIGRPLLLSLTKPAGMATVISSGNPAPKINGSPAGVQVAGVGIRIFMTDGVDWYSDEFRPGSLDVTEFGVSSANTGTQNDAAVALAIAAALALPSNLYWPAGTYLSAANIASLHSVRHRGPGAIRRGSDVFYVEPRPGQANRIYISASGSLSANDGLTSSQPMATPQNAFDALSNYGPMLEGTWTIQCAAGTYGVLNANFTTPSRNLVNVKGPDVGGAPNVPTFIIDGTGAGASDFGMRAHGPGVQVMWQDIKAQNYNNASKGNIAILADYGADLWTTNVHGVSCNGQVLYGEGCTIVRLSGGVVDGANQGILLNACQHVTVGYNLSAATQMVVKNCVLSGIELARGTEGHVDNCTLQGNAVGVDVFHNSRVHLFQDDFSTNGIAVRTRTGGYYYLDLTGTGNVFHEGTGSANTIKFDNHTDGGESDEDLFNCQSMRRRAFDKNSHTHTGTSVLTAVSTLLSGSVGSRIPAYWFENNTKKIIVEAVGEFTTAAALTGVGISLGGVEIDRITLTTGPAAGANFRYRCEIEAVGANSQFKKSILWTDALNPQLQQSSPTVTTSADLGLTFNVKLNSSGDTAKVFWTEVWLVG